MILGTPAPMAPPATPKPSSIASVDVGMAFTARNQEADPLVVRGMRCRLTMTLLALMPAVVGLASCSDDPGSAAGAPSREPDVRGVVSQVSNGGVVEHRLTEASPSYYEGMSLRSDAPLIVNGETGDVLEMSELEDGAEVEVWVDGCAESSPVQCGIGAVRVITSS